MAGGAGLTTWGALAATAVPELVAVVGIAGCAALAVALAGRWPDLLPWGVALLGAQYAASLLIRDDGIDALAPLFGAALFATSELAYWGLEARPGLGGVRIVLRRSGALVLLALGTAGAAGLLLAVSQGGPGKGFGVQLVGVLAAVATLALIAALAWRSRLR